VPESLLKLARDVSDDPTERELDVLLATGEQTTIALAAMAINALGGKAASLTGAQAGIVTDGVHTKARITTITPDEVHRLLDDGNIVIVAGFQGEAADGRITTLGRGGSDLTAIALAAAIKAIVVADLVMSLDNVIGVAAAAKGNIALLVFGLVISIPLIIFGSTLILKLMGRFPIIITLGAGLLGWVAGDMAMSDPAIAGWAANQHALHNAVPALGAMFVVAAGKWLSSRQQPEAANQAATT